jgi:chromate reductase
VAEIGDLPLYNDDLRTEGLPPSVERLAQALGWAQAFLFVTPEYNYSVPGVLKNAIDWGSRFPGQPFAGKAAAVMGASPGLFGAVRGQYHLRQIGVYLDLRFINKPEVAIAQCAQKFDAEGRLTDEPTRGFVANLVLALRDLAVRLNAEN